MKNNHYPVVLFLYKRPDSTTRILNLVIKAGANKIYIFADGPKSSQEKKLTDKVKKIISQHQNSNPSITFINSFPAKNIGLKTNIINGLNSVFKKETAAIILEDDCIPSLDFFKFTNQMLTKHKNNLKVMSITGTSINSSTPLSYDFSKYPQCWGWATWRRAWKAYDPSLSKYKAKDQQTWLKETWHSPLARWYWKNILDLTKKKIIDTWCYQWTYAHVLNQKLAVTPSVNLVTNVGFDNAATHTKVKSSVAGMKTKKLSFPLTHPKNIKENLNLTKSIENKFYLNPLVILGLIKYKLITLFK